MLYKATSNQSVFHSTTLLSQLLESHLGNATLVAGFAQPRCKERADAQSSGKVAALFLFRQPTPLSRLASLRLAERQSRLPEPADKRFVASSRHC